MLDRDRDRTMLSFALLWLVLVWFGTLVERVVKVEEAGDEKGHAMSVCFKILYMVRFGGEGEWCMRLKKHELGWTLLSTDTRLESECNE